MTLTMTRPEQAPAARNLLDLVPERLLASERRADGRTTVLEPRFSGRLGRWLQPRLSRPFVRIHLDDVGTVIWDACDGATQVRAIAAQLAERFGDDFDPQCDRLATFLQSLERRGYIRYRELASDVAGTNAKGSP